VEKDWEARFADKQPGWTTLSGLIRTVPAKLAVVYWIIVILAFFAVQWAGFDMISIGAIPMAALTAPSSLLAMAITTSLPEAILRPLTSTVGTFFVFPVVCGGLNAILIFLLGLAIQHRCNRRT
jgi:hypothetical protein